jgi:hypothetical protein
MDVFGFIDTDIAKKFVAKQPSELHISLENRVFEEGMEIGIRLGVEEIGE